MEPRGILPLTSLGAGSTLWWQHWPAKCCNGNWSSITSHRHYPYKYRDGDHLCMNSPFPFPRKRKETKKSLILIWHLVQRYQQCESTMGRQNPDIPQGSMAQYHILWLLGLWPKAFPQLLKLLFFIHSYQYPLQLCPWRLAFTFYLHLVTLYATRSGWQIHSDS